MNFTKAFITGGAGFIGSHVVDAVLSRGAEVVVYDNFCTGSEQFLPASPAGGIRVVRADVLDLAALTAAMAGSDFVFHLQANADVRRGAEKTRVDLEQNTIATWNVLEAMRLNGVKGIAFASSAAVYGEPEQFPTPETCAAVQTSLYGASKLAGEAMIQAYSEYYGIQSFIFRFVSWIGERYSHGVVFDFIKKLRQDPSSLLILGNGRQRKSYLYVKDGVAGILLGIAKGSERKNLFNLGHGDHLAVVDLARLVFEEMGLPNVEMKFTGTERGWIGDSPFVHLDTTRISNLGWKPEVSIQEGVRRTARFLLGHPQLLAARA